MGSMSGRCRDLNPSCCDCSQVCYQWATHIQKKTMKASCLISSGTAAAFRFTKEIFVPLYYACESRCCLCCLCCHFQTKCFLVSCQLVPSCYTTHYRGNLLRLLLPRQLQRGVPSTLPLRFDFGSTASACGSAVRSFSLRLFSPRLLNFVYCSSVVLVHGREGLAKILSCSPCGAWRSEI